ncbi:MAG: UDP-N-acetylglucosamine--N-acetylmuramyl-(pentapeptide) pyrophosphoryl-undecaprenol N-acetylglucosamine transferase [Candidatus Omnitrophica bacterium]|nr:UDP-N-acetylglucosamine--N-acetylmuramyl-(pentapeptide) pyrophosphoryl-undecaprenol N-acetylglucosamine transferase [Candidatus Omnitrophota bacterium]MCM8830934.1 UDP-N-acetylglucosamine--N-acetylmuramyl-(pentapeptide) pyrophosphoryl-undecaprenol N-acetylglucosamine transferase [Candidatus Omnitrophota bacterium]
MKVLLVCERSGGHIFPALTLAKKIKENTSDTVYFFATSIFFKKIISAEGFKVYGKSFRQRNLILEGFYRFFEAIFLICKINPKRIIGFGGRDSFFLIIVGSFLLIDTAIYEPNKKFGKANKVLYFFAKKVYCGFPQPKNKKIITVGIPLRDNIVLVDKNIARAHLKLDERPVILCFGGSQGSSFINLIAIRLLNQLDFDFQLVHITGKREYFKICQLYNKINKKAVIFDFCPDMQLLYSAADIVICRAGASSVAEISFYQLPTIFIAHPAAGFHQKFNAEYFVKENAAFLFLQDKFDFEKFKATIKALLENKDLTDKIRSNLKKIKIAVDAEKFYRSIYL